MRDLVLVRRLQWNAEVLLSIIVKLDGDYFSRITKCCGSILILVDWNFERFSWPHMVSEFSGRVSRLYSTANHVCLAAVIATATWS